MSAAGRMIHNTGARQIPAQVQGAERLRQTLSGLGTLAFFALVVAVLIEGWGLREDRLLTAESGLGYALGIVGGVMMLVLLLYPLRKRLRVLRFMGPAKHWFRLHMLMGVLGPVCILFHANFHLGALNSNVALWCMLIVASSGLLGRYFYSRIHHGLYGGKATLQELRQDSAWSLDQLASDLGFLPQLKGQLQAHETVALEVSRGALSVVRIPWLTVTTQFAHGRLWRECKRAIEAEIPDQEQRRLLLRQARRNLRAYFAAVRKVAEFSFYARLFSLWHVLHVPLFVMMLVTGIVHIVAVHMY